MSPAKVKVVFPEVSEAAKVTESPAAEVVMVTLVPATNVRVSVAESATTSLWPETEMVSKRDWLSLSVPLSLSGAWRHTF